MAPQQINLYQTPLREGKKPFSARTLLHATAAAFAVLAGIAAFSGWKIFESRRHLAAIDKQFLSLAEQKTALEQQITLGRADPALTEQVQRTEQLLRSRRQLHALLQEDFFDGDRGYSRYLAALARQHVPGLWLTGIRLRGAGHALALRGQTAVPALLPGYLRNLSREEALRGMEFQVFQLRRLTGTKQEQDQKKNLAAERLEFLVATSEETETEVKP